MYHWSGKNENQSESSIPHRIDPRRYSSNITDSHSPVDARNGEVQLLSRPRAFSANEEPMRPRLSTPIWPTSRSVWTENSRPSVTSFMERFGVCRPIFFFREFSAVSLRNEQPGGG